MRAGPTLTTLAEKGREPRASEKGYLPPITPGRVDPILDIEDDCGAVTDDIFHPRGPYWP